MNANIALYGKLAQLPLFIGMSHDELEHIVGKTKFNFHKVAPGEMFIREGDPCGQLVFLVTGTVEAETAADDRSYLVIERQAAPVMLQPERAFGFQQRFSCSYRAVTPCNLIAIDKNETQRLATTSLIFRLNLLNLVSTAVQKSRRQPWQRCPITLEQRIIRFFVNHCLHPADQKVFKIKMSTLGTEVNDNRLHVSQALNRLQDDGLLHLQRGIITIPTLERLLQRP